MLISEKFIGGEAYIFSICSNLSRGENGFYLVYAGLTRVKQSFTPAELKPEKKGHAPHGMIKRFWSYYQAALIKANMIT